jgi:hypothetical protein
MGVAERLDVRDDTQLIGDERNQLRQCHDAARRNAGLFERPQMSRACFDRGQREQLHVREAPAIAIC